jgi:uncharacterized protein YcfJ
LRRLEGVGGAAVGAAAFGLFSFRVSHGKICLVCRPIGWLAGGNRVKRNE